MPRVALREMQSLRSAPAKGRRPPENYNSRQRLLTGLSPPPSAGLVAVIVDAKRLVEQLVALWVRDVFCIGEEGKGALLLLLPSPLPFCRCSDGKGRRRLGGGCIWGRNPPPFLSFWIESPTLASSAVSKGRGAGVSVAWNPPSPPSKKWAGSLH